MLTQPALKILIVDDEPLARLRLRSLVEACEEPRAEVVAEAGSAGQAQQWLREHGCDLVLLDVQMPGADGLTLADALRAREAAPAVVFITAHAQHALRAFELDAVDYLTKPVRRERLEAALARAAQRLEARLALRERESREQADQADQGPVISISERGRLIRIPLAEVLYFKAELKYLTLRTAQAAHVMDGSLSELEQRLGERFLRVHRNALVAKSAVRELERHLPSSPSPGGEPEEGEPGGELGWAVRIAHVNEWLAVSRRQVSAVREALAGQGPR